MPLVLLAAATAAGWFAFWTTETPLTNRVAVSTTGTCLVGRMGDVTFFGAETTRFPDGSVGARVGFASDPPPLFAAFHVSGPARVSVEGRGARVRVRIDGRVSRTIRTRREECTTVALPLEGAHRVGVELGLGARLSSVAGNISPAPLPRSAPRVVFLGDSYTLGTGGSTPPGYAFRAGWAKGWDVRIDALSSTGFLNRAGKATYAERVPEVLRQHPSIVVVAGGINDYRNFPNVQIAAAAKRLFVRLEAAKARVIVLSPWLPAWFDEAGYRDLRARVAAAAHAAHARYIDTSHWLTPALMSHDRIHPNERGYRTIAARLALRL